MEDKRKLVVAATYPTAIQAGIAKTKLDAWGIPCMLSGEETAGLYPLAIGGFAEVRLMVFEADAEWVKEILLMD